MLQDRVIKGVHMNHKNSKMVKMSSNNPKEASKDEHDDVDHQEGEWKAQHSHPKNRKSMIFISSHNSE
jgi:hypothetical protein